MRSQTRKVLASSVDAGSTRAQLDVIIRLLAHQVGAGQTMAGRARLLRAAGVETSDIAKVLGTSPNSVRALTSGSGKT